MQGISHTNFDTINHSRFHHVPIVQEGAFIHRDDVPDPQATEHSPNRKKQDPLDQFRSIGSTRLDSTRLISTDTMNNNIMDLVGDDEVLQRILALSLNDRGAHSGPPPTSQYGLQEEVTDFEITEAHLEITESCVICSDLFTVGDDAKKLPCSHFFHDGCLIPWVTKVSHTIIFVDSSITA